MNPALLLNLIQAHFKSDTNFEIAVRALADDLEAEGNAALAGQLKAAIRLEEDAFAPSSAVAEQLPLDLPAVERKELRRASPLAGKRAAVVEGGYEHAPVGNINAPGPRRPRSQHMPSDLYSTRSGQAIPKDRDSALDLYEFVWPQVGLDTLELPEKQHEALRAIVKEWRKAPDLRRQGLHPTQTVLFCGPPGTGKTTAAHALAHEMGLPMAYVRLDSLVSSYLGQTSTNIRRIFDSLGAEPVVLFLDEFDAIAKKRDDTQEVGELKRIVITLLQNFDNVNPNVFIFAATNHPHLLDPAIWRRFDLTIQLELPGLEQRRRLLERLLSASNAKLDLDLLAHATVGLSGSQIQDIARRALKRAALADAGPVTTEGMLDAVVEFHTKFHMDEVAEMRMTKHLLSLGVTWREVEKILRTPMSTLRDRFRKYEQESKSED